MANTHTSFSDYVIHDETISFHYKYNKIFDENYIKIISKCKILIFEEIDFFFQNLISQ